VYLVNALSIALKATVHRNGEVWEQEYSKGKPLYDVRKVGASDITGTVIEFLPDDTIFIESVYSYEILAKRMRELAFLNKGIKISLLDNREIAKNDKGEQRVDNFYSEEGLAEFVRYIDAGREKLINDVIYFEGEKNDIPVEVAMSYNTSYTENIHTYVNNINTYEGGTHLTGFRRGLTRTLKSFADKSGYLTKLKFEINSDDFREGLSAVVSVKVQEPQFEGQTKTKLGNREVSSAVDQAVSIALTNYLEEHPNESRIIIEKVILAAQARHAASKAREMVQRKSVLSSGGLPGKLSDCSEKAPDKCEIYLVEGDSAGGTAKAGRDRKFQAILPLRGKILNVEKAMQHKIFENEEIKNIYTALGVTIGTEEDSKALNLDKLRYHKIVIMCDADIDGSHIATLILTFFFRYMKELVDAGYIYIATPPLYLVKKGRSERYCFNDEERDIAVEDLKGNGKESSVGIQRYKGLGEMNADQLWSTTMDPEFRTLRQINIVNAQEADRTFAMLMGDEVPPRRELLKQMQNMQILMLNLFCRY